MARDSVKPLVSALMLTCDRPEFVPMAVRCWLDQTWTPVELVVVDDGKVPVVLPDDPRIVRVRLDRKTVVGAKWNIAVEAAGGDFLIFWADDDWHHPARIERQMLPVLEGRADASAIVPVQFVDLYNGDRWKFHAEDRALDGTYLFTRAFAHLGPFPRTSAPEAAAWLNDKPPAFLIFEEGLYVGTRHGSNAFSGYFQNQFWKRDLDPAPLPSPVQLLVGKRSLTHPRRERVFKAEKWSGAESGMAFAEPEMQARCIASHFMGRFQDGIPFVVTDGTWAFVVTAWEPIQVEPYAMLPLGEELLRCL